MKKVVLILLYVLFTNVIYAQTDMGRVNRGLEAAVDKAVKEHNAKQKKAKEEAERKEREKARRHEQQRRQHEANYNRQMENLNQVRAEDFLNNPQQQKANFGTKVKKFSGQKTTNVVATPKKNNGNLANGNPFGNSGRIGSPSYSGLNYTGNRYDNYRAGLGNIQPQAQVRVPANQIRGQYKPNRNMRQGVVNLQRTNAMPKAKVQRTLQQRNNVQSSQQLKSVQTTNKVQAQPKQQSPVQQQKKVRINEKSMAIIDPSKGPVYVTLQQNNSSQDLAMVDTRRIDLATKYNNITIYNMPNEAPYQSDKDNKRPAKSGKGIMTDYELQQQMRKDMMNGMGSFNSRQGWERTYDYVYYGKVKTPSRSVAKKR